MPETTPEFRAEFGQHVRDALGHLYDPVYLQTQPLARFVRPSLDAPATRARSPSLGRALGQALLEAIEALRPAPATLPASHPSISYQILRLHFVDGLAVAAIQDRLAIGRTSYFAEQRQAVEAVASYLWDAWVVEASRPERPEDLSKSRLPTASEVPRHNLPTYLTSFVGRERELAEVRRLLGTTRLLTLTGTGGCGKTRLALQMAADLVDSFPDGVWLVDFASLADPSLVLQSVAFALGIRENPDRPIPQALGAFLQPKRLLLVLDNCEHLIGACAELADDLLRACPHLRILATSRELLSVEGETVWQVPPLKVPEPEQPLSVGNLLAYEAVRLFVERAGIVQPGFRATAENAPFLAQIAWRLDGMPLAIELAAARARGLSLEEIAEHLDDRFRLLTRGSRPASPRQQTLRATIDWSYDLLSDAERALLRRLSVFAGGWTLEAAEAVCSGGVVDSEETLDLLLQLVDKSLALSDVGREATRYRLLETVHQYAAEKLQASGEAPGARDRHLAWYLDLAERGAPELNGPDRPIWFARLQLERDNLRAAFDWGVARDSDADVPIRLAAALGEFWLSQSGVAEARERLERALAGAGGEPAARIRAIWCLGHVEAHVGNLRKADSWFQQSVELARQVGDKTLLSGSLMWASTILFALADLQKARALQEEALTIAREAGDRGNIAYILEWLTLSLMQLGDYERTREVAAESLAIGRRIGHAEQISQGLCMLGHLRLLEGDLKEARTLGEASLAQAEKASLVMQTALALRHLGDVARAEGDHDAAERYYLDTLRVWRPAMGGPTTTFLVSLAGLATARRQARRAARDLHGAVHAWMEAMDLPTPWLAPLGYERDEALARKALTEVEWTSAWAEGQAMTLEEAVEYALTDEGEA